MKLKHQRLLKVLLSAFACWQILTVFICPNPDSILFRYFRGSVVTYGNFFGLNTTWRFFSPDPNVRLFEYDTYTRDADGKLRGESFRYPNTLVEEPSREIFNRKMNNEMYLIARNILDKTLGPLICRWHPKAETIAVYLKGRVFPSLEKSILEGKRVADIGEVRRDFWMDINCHEPPDEQP